MCVGVHTCMYMVCGRTYIHVYGVWACECVGVHTCMYMVCECVGVHTYMYMVCDCPVLTHIVFTVINGFMLAYPNLTHISLLHCQCVCAYPNLTHTHITSTLSVRVYPNLTHIITVSVCVFIACGHFNIHIFPDSSYSSSYLIHLSLKQTSSSLSLHVYLSNHCYIVQITLQVVLCAIHCFW